MTRWTAAVTAVATVSALLRFVGLDAGLWYDEIVTLVEFVRPPLLQIVSGFPDTNNHPLYSVLAHEAVVVFGEHAWSLRLPAFVFGVASVPMLYWLGTAVTSRLEAFSAAALLAVSYHGVWFSQNARGYTGLLFWTMLATRLLFRLGQSPVPSLAIAYGIAAALGIYTHLTMAFVITAHGIVWLLWRPDPSSTSHASNWTRQRLTSGALALAVAVGLSAALYSPILGQIYGHLSGPPKSTAAVATPAWAVLEVLKGLRVGFGAVGVLAAATLAVLGLRSYARHCRAVAIAFVMPGLMTIAGLVLIHAPMRPRFFFSLFGFGLLVLVRGAMEAGSIAARRWQTAATGRPSGVTTGVALVAMMAVLSLASLPYGFAYPKQDFDGALEFLRSRVDAEPVGTAGLATYPYSRYHRMSWTAVETREQLDDLRARGPRSWLVYSFPVYMDRALVDAIRHHCTTQQIFRGTLDGGDVIVCTLEPARSPN